MFVCLFVCSILYIYCRSVVYLGCISLAVIENLWETVWRMWISFLPSTACFWRSPSASCTHGPSRTSATSCWTPASDSKNWVRQLHLHMTPYYYYYFFGCVHITSSKWDKSSLIVSLNVTDLFFFQDYVDAKIWSFQIALELVTNIRHI